MSVDPVAGLKLYEEREMVTSDVFSDRTFLRYPCDRCGCYCVVQYVAVVCSCIVKGRLIWIVEDDEVVALDRVKESSPALSVDLHP